jgi:hypothetical protein
MLEEIVDPPDGRCRRSTDAEGRIAVLDLAPAS